MILAGASANQVTILFFHKAPPGIQTGRFAVTVNNLPFASYTVARARLTQSTFDAGDGLWTQSTRDGAGAFAETLQFTGDVLVRWTLTKK
jgi:hypothetical protein